MYGLYHWPRWTHWLQEICFNCIQKFALCCGFLWLVSCGQSELFVVVHSDMHDETCVYLVFFFFASKAHSFVTVGSTFHEAGVG